MTRLCYGDTLGDAEQNAVILETSPWLTDISGAKSAECRSRGGASPAHANY
jgi:hypothetical protein